MSNFEHTFFEATTLKKIFGEKNFENIFFEGTILQYFDKYLG